MNAVPRFYFNLIDDAACLDDEGADLPDLEAACAQAHRELRSVAGHQVFAGSLNMNQHIEIADHSGEVLALVRLADALEILG